MQKCFALTMLLLCVSCSFISSIREVNILSNNLNESNLFVKEITYQSEGVFYDEEMCLAISTEIIWEPGDTATQLREQINSSVKIVIDEQEVANVSNHSRPIEISVIEDGKVVGSRTDILSLCFSIENLPLGKHIGSIQITSSSGQEFSADWEFLIK